ncbi:unnamed protein product [Protopolystoma xenopodis]|uniref:Uncharacterized protein n=1 Tax=Protopolystoma xenopodis TaxID=117903 RepID=A0A3S5BJQ0_9PLAT|nr:unnamed protein product [Protopolystoma xenopodis]
MRHLKWITSTFGPYRRISVTACLSVRPDCQVPNLYPFIRADITYWQRLHLIAEMSSLPSRDPFSSS